MYKVIVNERTFNMFKDKTAAICCARNCFDAGYDNVYITYGNGNHVPKTPEYKETERRVINPCWVYIFTEAKPYTNVAKLKADTIICVADSNKIDHGFYREFYYKGKLAGRYCSRSFYFDFGNDLTADEM